MLLALLQRKLKCRDFSMTFSISGFVTPEHLRSFSLPSLYKVCVSMILNPPFQIYVLRGLA